MGVLFIDEVITDNLRFMIKLCKFEENVIKLPTMTQQLWNFSPPITKSINNEDKDVGSQH